ncbi:hypothetical protein ABFG93_05185 [Pseudalkalibacillus hwajinpoensis]|uniref:hypothetical protein n=1 Tax=Guptibacillus hwajinpoensis TaxID=208199 RepID=UPI00325B85E6
MNHSLFEAMVNDHRRKVEHVNLHAWKYETGNANITSHIRTLKHRLVSKVTTTNSNSCCATCC